MNDINFLIIIVAVVFFFFVLRELFTWYWKINKLVEGQEKTNQLLQQLINFHLYGKLESPEQEEQKKKEKEEERKL